MKLIILVIFVCKKACIVWGRALSEEICYCCISKEKPNLFSVVFSENVVDVVTAVIQ